MTPAEKFLHVLEERANTEQSPVIRRRILMALEYFKTLTIDQLDQLLQVIAG